MISSVAPAKELESTALIRFQDCDPFGHLNNARYIDYFLNARQDQLASYYDFHLFEESKRTNHGWVVTKTQIAYLLPCAISEQVVIRTRLLHMDERSLTVEGSMLSQDGRQTKSILWMTFVYVNITTGRPARHPDELQQFFRSVQVDGEFDENGFNRRIHDSRHELR